jgi:hypothetical protein
MQAIVAHVHRPSWRPFCAAPRVALGRTAYLPPFKIFSGPCLDHRGELPSTALLLRSASDLPQLERWAAAGRTHILQPGSTLAPMVARELVARLETLETTMRTLVAEAASERKVMLHMLGELQYELRAARQENVQPVIVIEKIEDLGKSIMGLVERFDAMRTLAPASTVEARLAALENSPCRPAWRHSQRHCLHARRTSRGRARALAADGNR